MVQYRNMMYTHNHRLPRHVNSTIWASRSKADLYNFPTLILHGCSLKVCFAEHFFQKKTMIFFALIGDDAAESLLSFGLVSLCGLHV